MSWAVFRCLARYFSSWTTLLPQIRHRWNFPWVTTLSNWLLKLVTIIEFSCNVWLRHYPYWKSNLQKLPIETLADQPSHHFSSEDLQWNKMEKWIFKKIRMAFYRHSSKIPQKVAAAFRRPIVYHSLMVTDTNFCATAHFCTLPSHPFSCKSQPSGSIEDWH